jgi:pyrroloquinoline quinone biosynthesis protein B
VQPDHDRFYLVDATPDITRQIDLIQHPGFRPRASGRRPFDGIFLTHAHIGHYLGLALLGNEGLGIMDTPVFCTPRMAEFLRTNAPWSLLIQQGRIVPMPMEPETAATPEPVWHEIDENLAVRVLKVPHRDEFADTVGFVFRGPASSLLFLPDIDQWDRWDRDVAQVVQDVDIALLDGSFYSADELPGRAIEEIPHPLMPGTMDRLQSVSDAGDARIVFTHLNNSNPALDEAGAEHRETLRRGFEIAREGMRFSL